MFTTNQITSALVAYRSATDQDTATASSIAAALLSYYTIAQVDGLLAGKLGVTEAASALQIAVRFPDDGGADEVVAAPQLFASNTLIVTNTSDFSDDLFLTKNWAGWSKLQISNNSAASDSGPELRLLGNQSARVFLERDGGTHQCELIMINDEALVQTKSLSTQLSLTTNQRNPGCLMIVGNTGNVVCNTHLEALAHPPEHAGEVRVVKGNHLRAVAPPRGRQVLPLRSCEVVRGEAQPQVLVHVRALVLLGLHGVEQLLELCHVGLDHLCLHPAVRQIREASRIVSAEGRRFWMASG